MLQKLMGYFLVKITKLLSALNKHSFWIAVFWTAVILYLSFKNPSSESNLNFENADKVVHFTFYFGFVFLWFRYLVYKKCSITKNLIFLFLSAVLLGVLIEILQGLLTTNRQPDVWDAIANSLGALIGAVISKRIIEKNFN